MEKSITPADGEIAQPLSEFQRIGHNMYIWTPPHFSSATPIESPLVAVFAWNAAAAKHIAKYTVSYQKLFPSSRILLVRCWTRDMLRRTAEYGPLLEPALDLVRDHTKNGGEVLVHSFSNGGGNQVNEFAKVWKKRFGTYMPMRIQVIDSAPTKGPWMKSYAAISAGLPKTWFWRWFGGALVHLLLLASAIVWTVRRKENKQIVLGRELNDTEVFNTAVPRIYLYSKVDVMVGFEEADEHANIAISKGWDVTKVLFEKSAHCGHIREDEKKYWDAILKAWNDATKKN